jgi:MFS family permease
MGIETAAFRLLTPYWGSSLYTWVILISIIMLCLSIGYYSGGYLADKYTSIRLLYYIILAAGVYFCLISYMATSILNPMLTFIRAYPLSFFLALSTVNLILLGLPFIFLGMATPYIIALNTINRTEITGKVTGKVIACSTLGNIIGIFMPTFLSIPFWGTKKTILFFGLLLMAAATIGLIDSILKKATSYQDSIIK